MLTSCEAPPRPPPTATQRDAALIVAGFQEALAACNADKAAIANILYPHH